MTTTTQGWCVAALGLLVASTSACNRNDPKTSHAQAQSPQTGDASLHSALRVSPVTARALHSHLELVGSVAYDPDHIALVGPLVSGRVAVLHAESGTLVQKDQLLAEIESPEAGQAMAQFITSSAREHAATAQLARERELTRKRISSARDLEVAEAQEIEVRAERRAAEELLVALGLDPTARKMAQRGKVPLRSPIDGLVVNRFVTLGQAVNRGTDAFFVANLSRLWVELEIYEKDLNHVFVGQEVELRTENMPGQTFAAKVAFLEPTVDLKTRTTNMRLEVDNSQKLLRPGQFVNAHIGASNNEGNVPVLSVERSAVQQLDGRDVVFVKTNEGYKPRAVTLGAPGDQFIEVIHGLAAGEMVVYEGAFLLKAQQTLR